MESELDEEFRIIELRSRPYTIINNEPEKSYSSKTGLVKTTTKSRGKLRLICSKHKLYAAVCSDRKPIQLFDSLQNGKIPNHSEALG